VFTPAHQQQARLFLAGEHHGVAANYALRLHLLQFLHQHAGVRVLLLEQGYSLGQLAQRYLNHGHPPDLEQYLRYCHYTYLNTKQEQDFWVRLRAYNLRWPETERIQVVGLDLESQFAATGWLLTQLLPTNLPPALAQLRAQADSLQAAEPSLALTNRLAQGLAASLQTDSATWQQHLPPDTLRQLQVTSGLLSAKLLTMKYLTGGVRGLALREAAIAQAFATLAPDWPPTTKFFGQWGLAHLAQLNHHQRLTPWPVLVQQASADWTGRLVTIGYWYQNCQLRNPSGQAEPLTMETYLPLELPPPPAAPPDSTLQMALTRLAQGQPFHYLLWIRGSQAATTWAPERP
jgi:hypothetical protein